MSDFFSLIHFPLSQSKFYPDVNMRRPLVSLCALKGFSAILQDTGHKGGTGLGRGTMTGKGSQRIEL